MAKLDDLSKLMETMKQAAQQSTVSGDVVMHMLITIMKASKLLAERKEDLKMMRTLLVALLVKGFPQGISITRSEGRESLGYRLWYSDNSEEVLTLCAKPKGSSADPSDDEDDSTEAQIQEIIDRLSQA